MRSLYWLTAVTLVAAAVTTVAIADYGRRHPQSVAALWTGNTQSANFPSCCEKVPEPSHEWVTERMSDGRGIRTTERQPVLPPIIETTSSVTPDFSQDASKPIRIDDVPEHKQLREEALKNLASLQPEPPPLPPTTTVKEVVVDEFTFSDKPITPLYVPVQPNAPVVLPPAHLMQEVAKLPVIPGVSLSQSGVPSAAVSQSAGGFKNLPDYRFEGQRGAEVMPGLHAVRPNTAEEENPVYETMTALGELVAAMNPMTYLMSMPIQKKPMTKPTSFAVPVEEDAVVIALPNPCDDKHTCCPAASAAVVSKSCCNKDGACCKESGTCCKDEKCADEVVVRTYSVAEFTTSSGTNHDELIRLITTMVAPDGWSTKDATIEYFALGKCIVVRHRNSVQEKVEDLLTQLRGQVLKQTQNKVSMLNPVIRIERTVELPVELELVPVLPSEQSQRCPRVITDEPNRCLGDDDFFGMIPMRSDGRLMPVPMTLPHFGTSSLVPAQFTPKPQEPLFIEEGPVNKNSKPRTPEFFPWFLPYAPLPNGPDACEEELLNRVGFVSYTHEEIAYLFLRACEWEESK
ncbi:MAG TPA: hypothetical protein PLN21_10730 [Gemmatales bacterium]|nr:hypothetical protein [Gemmatales bacterium]